MSENRYKINSLIGKGRTGGVYLADDGKLDRKVALRRFSDEENRIDFTKCKDDFLEVAHSLINLQHANIARVLDTGEDEDGVYIVSEFLEGKPLYTEIEKEAMEVHEVVELARQMLDALSVIHDQGIYHGALTPRSILMTSQARGGYRYMILDVGLAKLAPLIKGENIRLEMMADHSVMAPELFDGSESNVKADLYMLGQIVYACLAGGHPYGGLSIEEVKEKHSQGLPSISKYNEDVPQELQDWLSTLTNVDPEERPDSAVEALQYLPQIEYRPAIPAPAPMRESEVVSGNPVKPSPVAISAESISKATAPVPITAPRGVQSITAPIPIYSTGVSRATKPVNVSKPSSPPKLAKETMRVNLKAPGLGQETMRVTLKAYDLKNVNQAVLPQSQLATAVPASIAENQTSALEHTSKIVLPEKKLSKGLLIAIITLTTIVVLLVFLIHSQRNMQVVDEEIIEYTAFSENEVEDRSPDSDQDPEE